jgi:hypothetical protein
MVRWIALVFSCIILFVHQSEAQPSSARDTSFAPNVKPSLDVKRRTGEIVIDGNVTDQGWQDAATAGNFCQSFPVYGLKPPCGTVAKITYDDAYLYVVMIAEDTHPEDIRAHYSGRDGISSDDFMGIILDTYGDGSKAFEIYSNPYGIQEDLFWTQNNEDGSYDLIYESEASITATGWQVEFKIPFSSLRFPDAPVQNFKCSFWRSYPRDQVYKSSWASINFYVPCPFCQFGSLSGITNIKSSGSFELLPSLVASQSAAAPSHGAPLEDDAVKFHPSFGARYILGTATGLEAALNPDFSQVEADAAQISANTTFALFYPERRPFFMDGADLLNTNIDAIYTRSINSPLVAAKAIHRDDATSIAYIGAYDEHSPVIIPLEERSVVRADEGRSIANILRATRTLGNNSRIGALVTTRSFNGDGSNVVLGLDGRAQLFENVEVIAQALFSNTHEPTMRTNGDTGTFDKGKYTVEYDGEKFSGYGAYAMLQRHTEGLDVELSYQELSPTFRALNGFVFTNDSKNANLWTGYKFPIVNGGWITEFDMSILESYKVNFEDQQKLLAYKPELDFSFIGQTNFHIAYRNGNETFRGKDFRNLYYVNAWGNTHPLNWLGFSANVWRGNSIARFLDSPVVGKELDITLTASILPIDGILLEPAYTFSRLDSASGQGAPYFSGAIYRIKLSYQFNRKLSARVIVQYNEFANALEIDPLITYQINPFTSVYLGSSHNYNAPNQYSPLEASQRQFFAKLQYLIQG